MQDVRDDALNMLEVLAERVWSDADRPGGPGPPGVTTLSAVPPGRPRPRLVPVVGSLPDSYQQFQYQLSAKLARCASDPLDVSMHLSMSNSHHDEIGHNALRCWGTRFMMMGFTMMAGSLREGSVGPRQGQGWDEMVWGTSTEGRTC
jgi:Cell morphogenesis central region